MKNSAVCLLWKHKNKTKVCYLLTKKDQEKTLPVERDKACFVARVTFKVCKLCTEGEIKYIPFIAYLDTPRDPRGVKR